MASRAVGATLNFQQVANNFGGAAASYDQHAEIQRQIGQLLRQQLPTLGASSQVIDLGCGTGYDSQWLLTQTTQLHAVDIAEGMLQATRQRCGNQLTTYQANVLELGQLDLQADLVWSNCMLQWADDLAAAMQQIAQTLKPGGYVLGSLFSNRSLQQLRQAWRAVDDKPHVIEMPTIESTQAALEAAGFALSWQQRFTTTAHFDDLNQIRDHLRGLGATNTHRQRNAGLVGKQAILKLRQALEQQRQPCGIPLDWEAWLFKAQKTA